MLSQHRQKEAAEKEMAAEREVGQQRRVRANVLFSRQLEVSIWAAASAQPPVRANRDNVFHFRYSFWQHVDSYKKKIEKTKFRKNTFFPMIFPLKMYILINWLGR